MGLGLYWNFQTTDSVAQSASVVAVVTPASEADEVALPLTKFALKMLVSTPALLRIDLATVVLLMRTPDNLMRWPYHRGQQLGVVLGERLHWPPFFSDTPGVLQRGRASCSDRTLGRRLP